MHQALVVALGVVERRAHDHVLDGQGDENVIVGLHPGDGDDVEVRIEEGVDDPDGRRRVVQAEDVAGLIGVAVEVEELDVIVLLELAVAVVEEPLHRVLDAGLADEDPALDVGGEEVQDGPDGIDVRDARGAFGEDDIGLDQDPLPPDRAQDLVLDELQGLEDDVIAVLPLDEGDPGRGGRPNGVARTCRSRGRLRSRRG